MVLWEGPWVEQRVKGYIRINQADWKEEFSRTLRTSRVKQSCSRRQSAEEG